MQYGKALKDENKLREAVFAYRRSIEIQPNGAAYNNLAIACNLISDKKCAIDAISKAIQVEPENPLARLNLGLNYFEEGRSKEAEMEFREAIRLMPVFPEAHKNLALLLLSRTPPEEKEALNHLELSVKQDPYQEEIVIMKKKIAELRNRLKTEH